MISDTFTLGVISGAIGNLVKDASNYLLYRRGLTTDIYYRVAGSAFLAPEVTERPMGRVVGQLTDLMIGAGMGVPVAYTLKLSGTDNHLLKGVAVGLGSWFLLYGFLGAGGLVNTRRTDPRTIISGFWNNVLYGAVTAYAAVKLGGPALRREKGANVPIRRATRSKGDFAATSPTGDAPPASRTRNLATRLRPTNPSGRFRARLTRA